MERGEDKKMHWLWVMNSRLEQRVNYIQESSFNQKRPHSITLYPVRICVSVISDHIYILGTHIQAQQLPDCYSQDG